MYIDFPLLSICKSGSSSIVRDHETPGNLQTLYGRFRTYTTRRKKYHFEVEAV
jgi:hypothetical protein